MSTGAQTEQKHTRNQVWLRESTMGWRQSVNPSGTVGPAGSTKTSSPKRHATSTLSQTMEDRMFQIDPDIRMVVIAIGVIVVIFVLAELLGGIGA